MRTLSKRLFVRPPRSRLRSGLSKCSRSPKSASRARVSIRPSDLRARPLLQATAGAQRARLRSNG